MGKDIEQLLTIDELNKKRMSLIDQKKAIEAKLTQINKMKSEAGKAPEITDHAMLRYIERVLGVDVEGLRKQIISQVFQEKTIGRKVVNIKGVEYTLEGRTIVMVIPRCKQEPADLATGGWNE